MEQLAPLGRVYQAGTLSGNPLAVAAGLQTLELLAKPGTYERLEALGAQLEARAARGVAPGTSGRGCVNRVGSMWTLFFGVDAVRDADGARALRHRGLRALLPRHAGARHLPAAVAVRGRLRLAGAQRGRHRHDGARGARGAGGAGLTGGGDAYARRRPESGLPQPAAIWPLGFRVCRNRRRRRAGRLLPRRASRARAPLFTLLLTLGGMGGALYRLLWSLKRSSSHSDDGG